MVLLGGGAGESGTTQDQSHDSLTIACISMCGVTFLISRMIIMYIFGWSVGHFLEFLDRSVLVIDN